MSFEEQCIIKIEIVTSVFCAPQGRSVLGFNGVFGLLYNGHEVDPPVFGRVELSGWKFGFIAVDFSGFLNLQLQRSIVYDTS